MTPTEIVTCFTLIVVLIAINAFFVMAEFSIVSVRRSRINQLVGDGDELAKRVQSFQQAIDRLLSTTQLGITLSSLALGWAGANSVASVIVAFIKVWALPEELSMYLSRILPLPLGFIFIAYLQIVLGELLPKSFALIYPEQLARFFGTPIQTIAKIFKPFVGLLNNSTKILLKLMGIAYTPASWYNGVTPEELQLIINTEREFPGLDDDERELINNVVEFTDVCAEEIMVPRTEIVSLLHSATFGDLLALVKESGYSKYPLVRDSIDDVIGMVDFKDLAVPLLHNRINHDSAIATWKQNIDRVKEDTHLSDVLSQMQRLQQKMIIVEDDHGGVAGLLTLDDLMAEITGEEPEKLGIEQINDHLFLVPGGIDLEELNQEKELNLPESEDYQTLAGFMIHQLDRIPITGEKLVFHNLELTVLSTKGPRIEKVTVRNLDTTSDPPLEEDGE